jgi:hypothetical protein
MKTLPNITNKQQELIHLIYRHRFLKRAQIQTFLHHADRARVTTWLKDLRVKQYIDWIYDPDDLIERNKPAIYHLGLGGIRFLKTVGEYPADELRKRYSESSRKQTFIDRCLLLADCCLNMEATTARDDKRSYFYVTEADYLDPDNDYAFLAESEYIRPHLYYRKQQGTGGDVITTDTLLEVIDATLPRYSLKKRLRNYVSFLESDEWQEGAGDGELPVIAFICPTKSELIFTKRMIRQLLEDVYGDEEDDIPDSVSIRLTTAALISKPGLTQSIWEEF